MSPIKASSSIIFNKTLFLSLKKKKKKANFKVAITEMYPRISWELVADPLGSKEHTLGTNVLTYSVSFTYYP